MIKCLYKVVFLLKNILVLKLKNEYTVITNYHLPSNLNQINTFSINSPYYASSFFHLAPLIVLKIFPHFSILDHFETNQSNNFSKFPNFSSLATIISIRLNSKIFVSIVRQQMRWLKLSTLFPHDPVPDSFLLFFFS